MQDHRPSTAATPASAATLFVALDLSRSSWVVAICAPHVDRISRHKLAPGAEALLALLGRVREQAERALGAPVRVVSGHEAGRDGFWLHRLLRGAGGPWCTDQRDGRIDPSSRLVHAMRTDSGRPSSSMRFKAWTAMATSVA
jgi:hypothetical protein